MEKMTLNEINETIEALLENGFNADCVNEDGEIDEQKAEMLLNELQIKREEKIENIALFIENLTANADAIGEKIKRLDVRKKQAERKAEWLKNYLTHILAGSKFETPSVKISFRKSTRVEIYDKEVIPACYLKVETVITPNKREILQALNGGEIIDGVGLIETQNINIK